MERRTGSQCDPVVGPILVLASGGVEAEINPLLVCREGEDVVAVDALICFAP